MTSEEIYERIQSLLPLVASMGSRHPDVLTEVNILYKAVYGIGFRAGCKNCVSKALGKLRELTLEKLIEMANSKYKLKKGVVIQFPAFSQTFISADNLTDAKAREMLKKQPDLAKHFDSIPADDKSGEPAKGGEKKTAAELIEAIKNAKTADDVTKILGDDERVTVKEAAEKRIAELSVPPAEDSGAKGGDA